MKTENVCFLIDDDLDDQEIFSLALEKVSPSFKCVTASSGAEALKKLSDKPDAIPDYIFLDLNMPRMNGKECLKEIKKLSHLKDTPVIIYSTSSLKNDMTESRKLGAAEFITKPFSMLELISVLNNFFEERKKINIQVD
jgi:CheY-like chemotaxis protein